MRPSSEPPFAARVQAAMERRGLTLRGAQEDGILALE